MAKRQKRLEGQVAIVTGAGNGIGRAEAHLLAREGVKVVVNDLGGKPTGGGADTSVAEKVVEEIRAMGGEAVANTDSVTEFAGGKRMVEAAMDHFGRLDILINNAGILRPKVIWEMTEDEWDSVVGVNLKGCFNTVRHAAPIFKQQKSGVIVNTSSNSGLGHYGMSNYAAAKEGVVGFTRSIAKDLGPYNVRCNILRPGATTRIVVPEVQETVRAAQEDHGFPAIGYDWISAKPGQASTPDQAAGAAIWLCTESAKDLNGRSIFIYGDEIGIFSEPALERRAFRAEGWDLDALEDPAASSYLIGQLKNIFAPKDSR